MYQYIKPLIIVTMVVLLGEWTAGQLAEYGSTFIGIGLALFAGVFIHSIITSKKSRP